MINILVSYINVNDFEAHTQTHKHVLIHTQNINIYTHTLHTNTYRQRDACTHSYHTHDAHYYCYY